MMTNREYRDLVWLVAMLRGDWYVEMSMLCGGPLGLNAKALWGDLQESLRDESKATWLSRVLTGDA